MMLNLYKYLLILFVAESIFVAMIFYTISTPSDKIYFITAEFERIRTLFSPKKRNQESGIVSKFSTQTTIDLDKKIDWGYVYKPKSDKIQEPSMTRKTKTSNKHSHLASKQYSQLALRNYIILERHGKYFKTYEDYEREYPSVLESINTETIIFSRIPSLGLGNQMFAYASGYAMARHNKRAFQYFNYYSDLERFFYIVQPRANKAIIEENISIGDAKCCRYDPIFLNLPHMNITLNGFFQSWKYFEKFKTEIRSQFRFQFQPDQPNSREVIDRIKQRHGNVTLIGVHIRRGDMIHHKASVRHGHKVADKNYLQRAISFYEEKFTNCFYIVCSDDVKWSKENVGIDSNKVVFSEQQSKEHDLELLTLCDHLIITVGTYGWWAGYLNRGTVVYYKDWPTKGSAFAKSVVPEDYFPIDWIGL